MALRITDWNGVNLSDQPPDPLQVTAASVVGGLAQVRCLIIEDGTLPYDFVTGTLSWNDGTRPVVYNGTTSGTLTINASRQLQPGQYAVQVEAHNYDTPIWDTVSVNFLIQVAAAGAVSTALPVIYGPILPKDTGYPNTSQWAWHRGVDLEILASSVKMLLTTAKGERLMQPEYGTNLRLILFELETTGIEGLVQQEILDALALWEPRVTLQFMSVEKTADREITVNATFMSKLNQKNFTVPAVFTP